MTCKLKTKPIRRMPENGGYNLSILVKVSKKYLAKMLLQKKINKLDQSEISELLKLSKHNVTF